MLVPFMEFQLNFKELWNTMRGYIAHSTLVPSAMVKVTLHNQSPPSGPHVTYSDKAYVVFLFGQLITVVIKRVSSIFLCHFISTQNSLVMFEILFVKWNKFTFWKQKLCLSIGRCAFIMSYMWMVGFKCMLVYGYSNWNTVRTTGSENISDMYIYVIYNIGCKYIKGICTCLKLPDPVVGRVWKLAADAIVCFCQKMLLLSIGSCTFSYFNILF